MGEAAYTRALRKAHLPLREVLVEYRVKLERTDEGYAVWCPGLAGCWSQGATEEEALENIKDATETYLATVEELTKDQTTDLVEVPVRPGQHCHTSPAEHPSRQPG
jgi:predicted RNase H-like HicB family nuclease